MTRRALLGLLATGMFGMPALAKPFFDMPSPDKMRYTPESAAVLRKELYDLMGVLPDRDRSVRCPEDRGGETGRLYPRNAIARFEWY